VICKRQTSPAKTIGGIIADGVAGRSGAGASGRTGGATAAAADTGAANQPVAGSEGGGQVGSQQTDEGDSQAIVITGKKLPARLHDYAACYYSLPEIDRHLAQASGPVSSA
jgi:hypothetical protein